jgi:hypothetical protein
MGGVSPFVCYESEAAEAFLRKVIIYLFSPLYYSITFSKLSNAKNFDFESVCPIKTMKNTGLV